MSWALIANPAAGGGRGRRTAEGAAAALQRAGRPVELLLTQGPGHALELARQALAAGCERLVVCGGDGTIRQVLPALSQRPVPLGLLPFGTANDLARALGIPRGLDRALEVLLQGQPAPMDLGRMGEALFCTVAAFGFDAEISEAMLRGQIPIPGTAGYLCATLGHLFRYRAPQVRLEGEFGVFEGEVLLVAAANTCYYGGGMKIAPGADPRDGRLDVCIVPLLPKRTILNMLPRIFWGGHLRHPAVRLERSSWLRLHSDQPRLLHADGEFLGHSPARLEVLAASLQVVLPPGA
jgi:diacylglycerol kinase (ATP)